MLIHLLREQLTLTWCPAILDNRGIPNLRSTCARAHRNCVAPPCIAMTPRFTSGRPKLASWLAMTKSQLRTISVPPPKELPLTAAIIGFFDSLRETDAKPCTLLITVSPSIGRPPCASLSHLNERQQLTNPTSLNTNAHDFRSAPAQNARPAPVTITTLTS
jgi:hypothetical protein